MRAEQILRELVSIKTVNDPRRGIRPSGDAARYIREVLEREGFQVQLLESGGYQTVFAAHGSERPYILFMAHYDTVPVREDGWTKPPFSLTKVGDRAYGRGTLDDKGNVSAMLAAAGEMRANLRRGTLFLAFTGDEEIGGEHGAVMLRNRLREEGKLPDYLVNGDGVGLRPIVRRRNSFVVKITLPSSYRAYRGRKAAKLFRTHTPYAQHRHAGYFIPGIDSHCLLQLARLLLNEPGLRLLEIEGGFVVENVLPDSCRAQVLRIGAGEVFMVDEALNALVRALLPLTRPHIPSEFSTYGVVATPNVLVKRGDEIELELNVRAMVLDREPVEGAYRELVRRLLPEARVEVRGGSGWLNTPEAAPIVARAVEALNELGIAASPIEREGASDSRFFSPLGVQAIDIGPLGGNMHGSDEYVLLSSLDTLSRFYARLALKLTGSS
jgi:succinyl-diaminopimelate desuccinylase